MTSSLNQQARRSVVWVALSALTKQGLDLLVFLGMARWLAPDAFGLMALVGTVLAILLMIADLGLGDALVQRRVLGALTQDTAFWLSGGFGFVLMAGLALLAWPLSVVYAQAEVAALAWAACPLVLMLSINTVPQSVLQRQMLFRPLALRSMGATLAGALVGLTLAALGAGVWSLLAQQLVAATVSAVLLWGMCPWRPRWRFSRQAARALLGFGRHVLSARAVNVIASKIDDAVIGAALGPAALGLFAVASRLRLALEQLFSQGMDAVALSAFSRLAHDKEALGQGYVRAVRLSAGLAIPVFASAAWLGPFLLPWLIGDKWGGAMVLLRILLVAGCLQAFLHLNHAVFRAVGQPQRSWHLGLCSLALNVALAGVAVRWGVQAVGWAYVLRVVLIGPVGMVLASKALGMRATASLRVLVAPVGVALCGAAVAALVWVLLAQVACPTWLAACASTALFWGVYVLWLWPLLKAQWRSARA